MATPINIPNMKTTDKKSERPKSSKKWRWTPEEDALLTLLVQRDGAGNWDHVARHIHGRSGKSCRVRWINQLNPKIDKSPFSEEEQRKLLELHEKYGNKWSIIADFFVGRTDNQLKNRYHVLMRNRCKKPSALSSNSSNLWGGRIALAHDGSPYGSQFSNVISSHGSNYCDFAPQAMNMPMIPFTMLDDFGMMPPPPSFPVLYGSTNLQNGD